MENITPEKPPVNKLKNNKLIKKYIKSLDVFENSVIWNNTKDVKVARYSRKHTNVNFHDWVRIFQNEFYGSSNESVFKINRHAKLMMKSYDRLYYETRDYNPFYIFMFLDIHDNIRIYLIPQRIYEKFVPKLYMKFTKEGKLMYFDHECMYTKSPQFVLPYLRRYIKTGYKSNLNGLYRVFNVRGWFFKKAKTNNLKKGARLVDNGTIPQEK